MYIYKNYTFKKCLSINLAYGIVLDTALRTILLLPLSLVADVTDATLGVSGLWLGTRKGVGGSAKLA